MIRRLLACLAALVAICASTAALSTELRFAHGFPPTNGVVVGAMKFVKYVEANSDIKIKVFHQSLLKLPETMAGVRDGIAEIGSVLPVYHPAEFPEANLAANLSMLATTGDSDSPGAAMLGAIMEYLFNCPKCLEAYTRQNQVYLGSTSTVAFDLLCTKPIRSLADLKGKRLRSGAANFGRWAEHFGAIQVSMPAGEIYEALSQGVVDCSMMSAADLTGLSLYDVVKFVVPDLPGGVFPGLNPTNVNLDAWRKLTTDQRRVLLQGAARSAAGGTFTFHSQAKQNLAEAPSKKVEVIKPSAEMKAASDAFVKADLAVIARQFQRDYKVADAEAQIERITALIERWKKLTAGLGGNEDALVKLYWDEVLSKVDPATYAMKR